MSQRPMFLGELIRELAKLDPIAGVKFDFCGLVPGRLMSYRGYYRHLALEWVESTFRVPHQNASTTVGLLLKRCQEAKGKEFEGYKGGEYWMNDDTPLWVAN